MKQPYRLSLMITGLITLLMGSPFESQAAPAGVIDLGKLQDVTLKGGMQVRLVERHNLPLVTLLLSLKVGSAADPAGQEGVANFVSELVRAGAGSRDSRALAEFVDAMGAQLQITTRRDSTDISLEVLSRDVPQAVELLADLALRPTFPESEIERTRARIQADIAARQDDPASAAQEAFMAELYKGHPYAHPEDGLEASISKLKREDILSFYRGTWNPRNAYLVAVGDFKAGILAGLIRKSFDPWAKVTASYTPVKTSIVQAPAPIKGTRVVLVHKSESTQAQLRIGNMSLKPDDSQMFALNVLNTALGGSFSSRLNEEIRINRSLSYGARSSLNPMEAGGFISVSTFTKNATVGETLKVALDTVTGVTKEGLKDEEFKKARAYAAGVFAQGVQTSDAVAAWLARVHRYNLPLETFTHYAVKLKGVSPADATAAQNRFPTQDALILIYGDKIALADQLKAFPNVTIIERQ